MRHSYQVGGTSACSGAVTRPASRAARTWLARLRSVTAQQDYFVTPYADVDMSALTHAAMRSDLQRAAGQGDQRGAQVPGRHATAGRAGLRRDRLAGRRVRRLRGPGQPGRDRLAHGDPEQLPDATHDIDLFTPSAITSALDGVDGRLQVALSDSTLSQVLADGPTAAQARASPGDRPSTAQASSGR